MSHEQWYEAFPERLREEKEALEERGFIFDEQSFEKEKTVIFKGILPEFPERNIIIEYPRAYPSIAPIVYDDGACEVLHRHQKASGHVYCLFGPEGKKWCANNTGADALNETARLLGDVLAIPEPREAQPDPNPEPPSAQPIFESNDMILVPPGISDHLPDDLTKAASGTFSVRFCDGNHRGTVLQLKFKEDPKETPCSPAYAKLIDDDKAKVETGVVIFLPKLDRPIYTTKDFLEVIQQHGFRTQSYRWHAIIFPEESGTRRNTRYSWLFFHQKKKEPFPVPVKTTTYRTSENSVRIPGLEWLPGKRIAVIGCGSIGSKVAVMLASSGVNKFTLVDKDQMEPSNSIRHECGIDTFAYPKTQALANRLISINPECAQQIFVIQGNLFGKCDTKHFDMFLDELRKCDLILNASGNDRIGRFLNQIAYKNATPCLHASVTNGAWSGEVIRSIPGKTPCWQCWDHAFGDNKPPGEPIPEEGVYGPGCDQPTFTGTSYEVGMLANLAAAFAVDTLRSVETGASVYTGDYLLWEGKDHDGKPLLRTTIQQIPHRKNCPLCGQQS
jgi:molybdopterin/thiamine biosynthesis adenylyltransferase